MRIKIYGIWPQANKHARKLQKRHVSYTLPQCSPASVGLARARPK